MKFASSVGQNAASTLLSETNSKGRCEVLQLDVSSSDSIKQFSHNIKQHYDQQIHTLVNNAGILEQGWNQSLFEKTIKTNVEGPVQIVDQILPCMQEGGRIVNVSSGLGSLSIQSEYYRNAVQDAKSVQDLLNIQFKQDDRQNGYSPTYCVSKAMLNRCTQMLAQYPQIVQKNISVNAVCPGWCRTGMGGSSATRSAQEGADSIMWLVNHPEPCVSEGFYRDGQQIDW
eukprot:TRINITY_DN6357_c0_g2_i3.p1 TRINITY_DN6357_c0_g2~~TRINITY_DN6357_c0_g2_i3.p1  ORF type:complete len:228 (-),score=23.77 TRINITY_DN6357_c0_g2_i3:226-909(-)